MVVTTVEGGRKSLKVVSRIAWACGTSCNGLNMVLKRSFWSQVGKIWWLLMRWSRDCMDESRPHMVHLMQLVEKVDRKQMAVSCVARTVASESVSVETDLISRS